MSSNVHLMQHTTKVQMDVSWFWVKCVWIKWSIFFVLFFKIIWSALKFDNNYTIDLFHWRHYSPVPDSMFTRSFLFVLGLIHAFCKDRFIPGTQNPSPSWMVWQLDIAMLFICIKYFEQMNIVLSGIWKLHPTMKQTCGCPHLMQFCWLLYDVTRNQHIRVAVLWGHSK